MSVFKPTEIRTFPGVETKLSAEAAYWKRFEFPVTIRDNGPIDLIDFCPVEPYLFAASCSAKVQVYTSNRRAQVHKTLSRFTLAAYGARFRFDGKLVCAGSEEKLVRIFNLQTKTILRVFKGHSAPVHRVAFSSSAADGARSVVSFSDDQTVRLWDLANEVEAGRYEGHGDCIRAGSFHPTSGDLFISGSYDGSVRMWDRRCSPAEAQVRLYQHGTPVESVLVHPSGGMVISSGGTNIHFWDLMGSGGCKTPSDRQQERGPLVTLSHHHKTITCLSLSTGGNQTSTRLLSGSLDRHVKVYDLNDYSVIQMLNYPSPVLSVGVAGNAEESPLVVGMTDGLISVQHRRPEQDEEGFPVGMSSRKKKALLKRAADNERYSSLRKPFLLNNLSNSESTTIVKEHLGLQYAKYDEKLRKFEHSRALDLVLSNYTINRRPDVVLSVVLELIRRGALVNAIAGRHGKSVIHLFSFATKWLSDPRYTRVVLDLAFTLIDVYENEVGHVEVRKSFDSLKNALRAELRTQDALMKLTGSLDMVIQSHLLSKRKPNCLPVSDDLLFTDLAVNEVEHDCLTGSRIDAAATPRTG